MLDLLDTLWLIGLVGELPPIQESDPETDWAFEFADLIHDGVVTHVTQEEEERLYTLCESYGISWVREWKKDEADTNHRTAETRESMAQSSADRGTQTRAPEGAHEMAVTHNIQQQYVEALQQYRTHPVIMELDVITVLVCIGALQLALRHHNFPATSRRIVEHCIEHWSTDLATLNPIFLETIHLGSNPAYDVPYEGGKPKQA